MASIKSLKKDIHHTLGDLIEECYVWEYLNPKADTTKSQEIVEEAVAVFDDLMAKIHTKGVENKKAHYQSISKELEDKARTIANRINTL